LTASISQVSGAWACVRRGNGNGKESGKPVDGVMGKDYNKKGRT
jgi:hypothetical protein